MKKAVSEKLERTGTAAFSSLSFTSLARVGAAVLSMASASKAMMLSFAVILNGAAPTNIIWSLR